MSYIETSKNDFKEKLNELLADVIKNPAIIVNIFLILLVVPFVFHYYDSINYLPLMDSGNYSLISSIIEAKMFWIIITLVVMSCFTGMVWGININAEREKNIEQRSLIREFSLDTALFFSWLLLFLIIPLYKHFPYLFYVIEIFFLLIGMLSAYFNAKYLVKNKKFTVISILVFISITSSLFIIGNIFLYFCLTLQKFINGHYSSGNYLYVTLIFVLLNWTIAILSLSDNTKNKKRDIKYTLVLLGGVFIFFTLFINFNPHYNKKFTAGMPYYKSFHVTQENSYMLASYGIHSTCDSHDICITDRVKIIATSPTRYYIEIEIPADKNDINSKKITKRFSLSQSTFEGYEIPIDL